MLSGRITEVPGASSVFECGVAAYSKEIKHDVLGGPGGYAGRAGAVSPEVACAMAIGAPGGTRRPGRGDHRRRGTGSQRGQAGGDGVYRPGGRQAYLGQADYGRSRPGRPGKRCAGWPPPMRWDLVRRYLEAMPSVIALAAKPLKNPARTKWRSFPGWRRPANGIFGRRFFLIGGRTGKESAEAGAVGRVYITAGRGHPGAAHPFTFPSKQQFSV